jgi:hypothetical protein
MRQDTIIAVRAETQPHSVVARGVHASHSQKKIGITHAYSFELKGEGHINRGRGAGRAGTPPVGRRALKLEFNLSRKTYLHCTIHWCVNYHGEAHTAKTQGGSRW